MTALIRLSKPCDECGGTGWLRGGDWRTPNGGTFGHSANSRHWQPCPSCVGGWLPDDETVVALRKVIPCVEPDAIRALVAAARYQSEREQ